MATPNKPLADRIWDFACSLKLAIIVVLLLAATSIIGTIIQQNAPAADYIREYGQSNYELFKTLQFIDMYHSTWFIGLLALFALNLICCSIKNFPRVWKFVTDPTLIASSALLKGSANRADFSLKGDKGQAANTIATLLSNKFAKATLTEKDDKLYLFAQKGIYSRFGAYITHLSILIIMAGALVGNFWGYKAFANIVEGTAVDRVRPFNGSAPIKLGFMVRCDDFDVSYYGNTRRPKDYNSDLVIIENGQEVLRKRIEVNDPLTYKGIKFYQSSYGPAGASFQIKATEIATGKTFELEAEQGKHVKLTNGYSFAVTDFTPDYRKFGPAIQLHVNTPDGNHGQPFLVLKNHPQLDKKRGGKFVFSLSDYKQLQYTGLQVAKDPGVNIVWAGCFLIVFGSLTAFFFSHKRIWVCLEDSGKKTKVTIAGNAHRNQPGFALAFEELTNEIEAAINNEPPTQKEG